jgi:hypothetical protein
LRSRRFVRVLPRTGVDTACAIAVPTADAESDDDVLLLLSSSSSSHSATSLSTMSALDVMSIATSLTRAMRTKPNGAATDADRGARDGDTVGDAVVLAAVASTFAIALGVDSNRVMARRTALVSVSSAARSSDDNAMMIAADARVRGE